MAQYTHGCPVLANHIHASKPMNTILHLNTDCGTANYRHVMKEVGFELWLVQVQTDHYTTTTICLWYIPYTPHVTVTQAYWQRVFCVGGKLISWSTFLALECSLEQVKMNRDTITCVCMLFFLCCSEVKVCASPNYGCKFTTSSSVLLCHSMTSDLTSCGEAPATYGAAASMSIILKHPHWHHMAPLTFRMTPKYVFLPGDFSAA